jgi:hypothetical protein
MTDADMADRLVELRAKQDAAEKENIRWLKKAIALRSEADALSRELRLRRELRAEMLWAREFLGPSVEIATTSGESASPHGWPFSRT